MAPSVRAVDSISKKPTETWAKTSFTFTIPPLKDIGESYKIDPVRDMIPLCPNCHAMVHRSNESRPLAVEVLRSIIDESKKRAGATG
jgi:hypothetical protein